MKKFNLQEAKAGKPVCTRDGKNARIICFDRKNLDNYPIVALVDNNGYEAHYYYTNKGNFKSYAEDSLDLFMAPEKHVGWVNIYGGERGDRLPSNIFNTEEEAVAIGKDYRTYITTTKIEWEE